MTNKENPSSLMSGHELSKSVPYSRQQIKRMENSGIFPRRVRLGPNKISWVRKEVEDWLTERLNDRLGEKFSANKQDMAQSTKANIKSSNTLEKKID